MLEYLAFIELVAMVLIIVIRIKVMKRLGIEAFKFGKIDKKDFLIPPFVVLYFYLIIAHAFDLPTLGTYQLFNGNIPVVVGVVVCLLGLIALVISIISFRNSFRVGIDLEKPDRLITDGIFALSRNPIYVSFAIILAGQFFCFSSPLLLIYAVAAILLFNRQIKLEEGFLLAHYGAEYSNYCARVRRYI